KAYEEGDKRLEKTWLMGKRYHHANPDVVVWECINYLPSLTCMRPGENATNINWGYRVGKFEYDMESTGSWSNDFAYFRYAEILLSKAEALMRQGKDEGVAADLVSQIRARVFDDPAQATVTPEDLKADTRIQYGTYDWDNNIEDLGDQTPVVLGGLYDEWGFEFACEAQRRSQMIRFGTFTTKNWFNHTPQGSHVTIFPIPYDELQVNPNLKQNPGY
ncbi:MAG: RagB/SusD family nutrient uptake outer membrane protein, partial [Bacteroides sp.]|nr:RagB/SusD family nutrient uptake outer membrane protein [Bacteroides sp.]